ncbi:MAG: hypothetical protein J6J62_01865 [Oscillospiraceae bacterium]|nr:hypothetical protein [Oscillospiraceae bacterium]
MKNDKLRLLLLEECNRNCPGCCNNYYDLQHLKACEDYTPYRLIMLTGGEPMIRPDLVKEAVADIRAQTNAPIYIYTAMVEGVDEILGIIDGVTLTLHAKSDRRPFEEFLSTAKNLDGKALRLNVFDEVGDIGDYPGWKVKKIYWRENCPVPQGEDFMRYRHNMPVSEKLQRNVTRCNAV